MGLDDTQIQSFSSDPPWAFHQPDFDHDPCRPCGVCGVCLEYRPSGHIWDGVYTYVVLQDGRIFERCPACKRMTKLSDSDPVEPAGPDAVDPALVPPVGGVYGPSPEEQLAAMGREEKELARVELAPLGVIREPVAAAEMQIVIGLVVPCYGSLHNAQQTVKEVQRAVELVLSMEEGSLADKITWSVQGR